MMMDQDIVAVSPSSVYRVLSKAGLMKQWSKKESRKGSGFVQPLAVHEHWHIDISYLNIKGTFYYLCSVLDGCSRYIVHHEIRESMKESDVEMVLQRAKEKYPAARPRIISDNGPQFTAEELRKFAQKYDFEHVTSSPHYPRSNGKVEAAVKSAKRMLKKTRESGADQYLALLDIRNTPTSDLPSPAQRLMNRRTRTLREVEKARRVL